MENRAGSFRTNLSGEAKEIISVCKSGVFYENQLYDADAHTFLKTSIQR